MTNLSKDEKLQIINSRARGLEYKKYGLEVDLLIENAKTSPSAEAVANINSAMSEIEGQLSALNLELADVNSLTE